MRRGRRPLSAARASRDGFSTVGPCLLPSPRSGQGRSSLQRIHRRGGSFVRGWLPWQHKDTEEKQKRRTLVGCALFLLLPPISLTASSSRVVFRRHKVSHSTCRWQGSYPQT